MKKLILVVIAVLVYHFIFSQEIVTDIDGYEYNTVQIGNQTWLKEHLRVTRYNDGTPITDYIEEPTAGVWQGADYSTTDACTYYNFDLSIERFYGKHYNGYVVRNEKNVCPVGWKVPSNNELTELIVYADPNAISDSLLWGMQSEVAQIKLLSDVPFEFGGGGTNETGFSFLMSGYVDTGLDSIEFNNLYDYTLLWTKTPAPGWEEDRNYTRHICLGGIAVNLTHLSLGLPIRCLKDVNYDPSAQVDEIKIEYTIYPNPVIDRLNVVVDQSSIGKEYTITDMSGKILIQDQIPSQEFQIDMSGLSGGVYNIGIEDKQKKVIRN
jgi:uncharacterized protein (TIGR02145 family)